MSANEIKWKDSQTRSESELLNKCTGAVEEVISNLLPRIREKALEEGYKSEVVLNLKLDLRKTPKVAVDGFVPPKILKCRKY